MKLLKLSILRLGLLLMGPMSAFSQTPYLVKDIFEGATWSRPKLLTKVGQTLFFEALNNNGWGLWKSDGTDNGTVLLKNFGVNYEIYDLADVNGVLYFRANDGTNGYEPWKSDGTVEGTVMVKDIYPGAGSSSPSEFIYFNNTIFFVAVDNTNGAAIWTTDGTSAGTTLFNDLTPGSTIGGAAYGFKIMNDAFYFWANPVAQTNIELWKSDGTASGTALIKAFNGITTPAIKVSNNKLFFAYGGGATDSMGVWVSDGTTAGTILLKGLNVAVSVGVLEDKMIDVNGVLFLSGDDRTNGKELWKTDGTPAGTIMVKNIKRGSGSSSPGYLTNYRGNCYFVALDDNLTTELWKSDGTDAGTVQIETIFSGSTQPTDLVVYNNNLFFNASPWSGNTGIELWKSNGTTTEMVYDIYPGSNHSSTMYHTGVNNKLFFQAEDAVHGKELWAVDVTPPAGLLETTPNSNITIYPNPTTDNLYLDARLGEYTQYKIYDINGSLKKEGRINQHAVSVSDLPVGLFLMYVNNKEGQAGISRFIKQ